MVRYPLTIAMLTLVYALALASFDPWDLALGAALSAVLLVASRSFIFGQAPVSEPNPLKRLVGFFPLAAVVVWDVLVGTLDVMLVTLHLRPLRKPGIVAVPIGERTPSGIAVWTIITGLPPGSFFVDLDRERQVALIHVLDASDPDAYRQRAAAFYRRYQSKVFP